MPGLGQRDCPQFLGPGSQEMDTYSLSYTYLPCPCENFLSHELALCFAFYLLSFHSSVPSTLGNRSLRRILGRWFYTHSSTLYPQTRLHSVTRRPRARSLRCSLPHGAHSKAGVSEANDYTETHKLGLMNLTVGKYNRKKPKGVKSSFSFKNRTLMVS